MNMEQAVVDAFRAGDFSQALKLGRDAIAQGQNTETMYRIVSECELKQGNRSEGFSICLQLAEQTKSIEAISRLVYWTFELRHDFQESDLERVLEITVTGVEAGFATAPPQAVCHLIFYLGVLGFWVDDIKCRRFSEFSRRILEALPVERSQIADTLVGTLGVTSELRWSSHFLAAGGWTDEAEDLLYRVSIPLTRMDQLATIPENMTARGATESPASYDNSQPVRRRIRRLVELSGERKWGRVLDIGCGTGLVGERIREQSDFIHGVDPDTVRIAALADKKIYDRLDVEDFLLWDGKGGKFDTLVCCMVTYLVPDFVRFVSAMESVMAPDACAYIDALTVGGDVGERQLDDYVLRTRDYIRQTVENAGLRIVQESVGPNQFAVGVDLEIARAS